MQLQITTDYAIRCVLYLAMKDSSVNALEISEAMCIPHNYVQQILRRLRIAELVDSSQGRGGGYKLAKDPKDISMMDIMVLFEKTMRVNRCLEDDHFCSWDGTLKGCPVNAYYKGLQKSIENYLIGTSIADILDNSKGQACGIEHEHTHCAKSLKI